MASINPLLHGNYALIILSLITVLSFYDYLGVLNPINLERVKNQHRTLFERVNQEHLGMDLDTSQKSQYLDKLFLILVNEEFNTQRHQEKHNVEQDLSKMAEHHLLNFSDTVTKQQMEKPYNLLNNATSIPEFLRVLFTGTYIDANPTSTWNIISQSLRQDSQGFSNYVGDSMFEQLVKNNDSTVTLITNKNAYKNWAEAFGSCSLIQKKLIEGHKQKDLNTINILIEKISDPDSKGLIIADLTSISDSNAISYLQQKIKSEYINEPILEIQLGQQEQNYINSNFILDTQRQSIVNQKLGQGKYLDLLDLSPTILSLLGTPININNNGQIQESLYQAFLPQQTQYHFDLMLYANTIQIYDLYLKAVDSYFFKDDVLSEDQVQKKEDFTFLKDYFITYLSSKQQDAQRHEKFVRNCELFRDKVVSAVDESINQPKSVVIPLFNYLRAIAVIIAITFRGCVLIIENEQEINNAIVWATTISVNVLILFMIVYRKSFTFFEFLLNFTVVNCIQGAVCGQQIYKGEIKAFKKGCRNFFNAYFPMLFLFIVSIFKYVGNRYIMPNNTDYQCEDVIYLYFAVSYNFKQMKWLRQKGLMTRKAVIIAVLQFVCFICLKFSTLPDCQKKVLVSSQFLHYYVPTLLLIVISDLILSNSDLMIYINQQFLAVFRIKHALNLLVIPRIWQGDTNVLLKSSIYDYYWLFQIVSSISIWIFMLMEGVYNHTTGRYFIISDRNNLQPQRKAYSEAKYSHYFQLKQQKFELALIFVLNVLPNFVIFGGEHNYYYILGLLTCMFCVLYMETIMLSRGFNTGTVIGFFLLQLIYNNSVNNQPNQSKFILNLSEYENPEVVAHYSIKKNTLVDTVGFLTYCLYAIYREDVLMSRKVIDKALNYERYYENAEDIQKQVLNNQMLQRFGVYLLAKTATNSILFRTYMTDMQQREGVFAEIMSPHIMLSLMLYIFIL